MTAILSCRALEDMVIGLGFNARSDSFGASLQTLTENSDAAFDFLRLAMTEPRFDAEPVERIRAQTVAGLKRSENRPQSIASRVWWRAAFPDHPYGRPSSGTIDSIERISTVDMKAFAERVLTRTNLKIGVVGDISPGAAGSVARQNVRRAPGKGRRDACHAGKARGYRRDIRCRESSAAIGYRVWPPGHSERRPGPVRRLHPDGDHGGWVRLPPDRGDPRKARADIWHLCQHTFA